jgi:hypothetical protein
MVLAVCAALQVAPYVEPQVTLPVDAEAAKALNRPARREEPSSPQPLERIAVPQGSAFEEWRTPA